MSAETLTPPTPQEMNDMYDDALAMKPYMDAALEANPMQHAAVDAKSGGVVGAANPVEQRMVEDINRKRAERVVIGAKPDIFTVPDARHVLRQNPERAADYAQEVADSETDLPETMPDDQEVRRILQLSDRKEAENAFADATHASHDALQANPASNTGVDNRDFAAQQFRVALNGARLSSLEARETADETAATQLDEQTKSMLQEADMWERMAQGEPLTSEETGFVRNRALVIRQTYQAHDSEPTQKPTTAAYNDEEIETARRRAARTRRISVPTTEAESSQQPEDESQKELLKQVPDDPEERLRFAEREFGEPSDDKIPLFNAYIQKAVKSMAARVPENGRYPDSVAGIFGNAGSAPSFFLQVMASAEEGRTLSPDEFKGMRFSDAVKKYLDLDIREAYPEFDEKFS